MRSVVPWNEVSVWMLLRKLFCVQKFGKKEITIAKALICI